MKTEEIADRIARRAAEGERFHCDIAQRTLRIGKDVLVSNGSILSASVTPDKPLPDTKAAITKIEELYAIYKHSLPSERSESRRRRFFKALPEERLDAEDMLYAEGRDSAQARLETYVLLCILQGCLHWEEFATGTWFWKSPSDPDLVILRSWIDPPIF